MAEQSVRNSEDGLDGIRGKTASALQVLRELPCQPVEAIMVGSLWNCRGTTDHKRANNWRCPAKCHLLDPTDVPKQKPPGPKRQV